VFWVDVDMPSTAKNGFLAIARALGSPAETIDDSLHALANTKRRWLLVLDNADDFEFNYAKYIPSGNLGAVIITSRVPECSQYNTHGWEALEGLDLQLSTQLLLKAAKLPESSWPSNDRQAHDVVHLLGSHTLALIQAGAYIAGGYCGLGQYPAEYQRQRKRMLAYYPKQEQSRYGDVYATFEASASVLRDHEGEAGKDALDLLTVLSILHSGMLPLQIFGDAWTGARKMLPDKDAETGETENIGDLTQWHTTQLPESVGAQQDEWDDYRLKRASNLLASLSLVTTRYGSVNLDGLSMHPLAHAWAKDRLTREQQKEAWVRAGCLLSLSIWALDMWHVYENQLRPHLQAFLSHSVKMMFSFGPSGAVLPILLECGYALNWMREDSRLESLLEGIYGILQIAPSDPSREYVEIWDLAARNMGSMGHARQAVALLEHVVNVRKTTLAETHPIRLTSQHELASAYRANGQTKDAVVLLKHVVKIRETTLVEIHPDRLSAQHELAKAYLANGQTKDAVVLLKHVVKMGETTLAETHPDQLASQHELACAYLYTGQTEDAVELLKQVVKVRETTLAETHPNRLESQHELAIAYHSNGQTKDAVALLEQVVAIESQTLRDNNPSRLLSQHELAIAYHSNGQTKDAVALLERVVAIGSQVYRDNHPSRLASQHALAIAYSVNGQTKDAVVLLEHVVAIESQTLRDDDPERLASIKALQKIRSKLAEGEESV
jgi:tetratricopeptide (TPR) repeat protein